ncbi:hypothetical protein A4D02_30685 [Niastella koreensis]|uniref:TonB-dependent receptor plug n=2 Tax=Niastella koreensis TaxID=354356 RepID=G8THR1_NIAKG|nr:TonB-dependent receptor plug domain-containing protein [Niastella koreensis]AEV97489.1 TonB-dependent receptor plug [Niastella koreensis GR20-10]OQP47691.1 hypothetical protein A4D02_30685 [Niastella koreensis]
MRKAINTCLLILMLIGVYPFCTMGQTIDYVSNKEKVYVQTSHVFFKPGETLFFKLYVVNANSQLPSFLSNVVYADIIGPSGNLVQKISYGVENGYAEGSFQFSEEAAGGVYKLRAYTTWMRNENEATFFTKEITVLKVIAPRLLMKLDFPEKGYGPGDEVKADFSIRDLNDQPVRNHAAAYKVSIGGEVVQTNTFQTSEEGKAQLRFMLPKALNTADGLLNITIEYDANRESISRSIPIVLNKIDLQFMPEGGTLVQGIATQVAFKAINEHGKPVDVKGTVINSRGNKVTDFESLRFGMGKFAFTPRQNETYTAHISAPANITQTFSLPHALAQGSVMNIAAVTKGELLVKLSATGKQVVAITGQTKNTTYFSRKMELQPGVNDITIDISKFPAGIARFTLFTADSIPVAERLVFLNEQKNLQVSITTDKPIYLPRQLVSLTIKSLDEKGNPVPSNLSLAVLDDKLWSFADDKQDHILSWLLMSSELNGKIEEPDFYFKKEEPTARPALDLVMLTNGYRYFDYTSDVKAKGKLAFAPDQPYAISGTVLNAQQKPVKATVYLVQTQTGGKAVQYKTGEDGTFVFNQVIPNSRYYLFARAAVKKEKVTILVIQNGVGYDPDNKSLDNQLSFVIDGKQGAMPEEQKLQAKPQPVKVLQNAFDFDNMDTNLDDVIVVGYGGTLKKNSTGSIVSVKPIEITPNNITQTLQGRVGGLYIEKNANPMSDGKIMIRGSRSLTNASEPLIVVDGVPMEGYRLNALAAADIESITVSKDAAAVALYGSRAAYGAIVVVTKTLRTAGWRINLPAKYYYATEAVQTGNGPAFTVARRFYAPEYVLTEPQERNDFRETIYWNPVIQTDRTGTARVEFYNSDAATTFRAIAEGIGYNGKAGRAEHTYVTKNALAVDAKIPPYLTVGDKALIPLVIKNNRPQEEEARVSLVLPANMRTTDFTNTITVPADSARQLLIPVTATAATDGKIQFIVETNQKTETLTLPITAAEKGFPVVETFSGNQSGKHVFNVNKVIPGSVYAKLKLFKTLEGQLLDGIESMLREPNGCFEQTSSATYPNIFVLKYLRESGRSNKAIEKKALDYIDQGYKRLIGFETKQNGFEWFGHTLPHEALTAYGLMEFTDMQEFINVDKHMLERTKKFLLGRRDGKGGFSLSTGGYDRFASVPDKIANTYIVYALTQAGLGNDINLEYETAVKKALESNDGYQLAMMALSASNMKREKDLQMLMNALNTNYLKSDLAAETSVVNSRDASLRVETASLYALALMRQPSPDMGILNNLIARILKEKSYYGYGSTQATVMALQAIVAYSKLIGRLSENPQITFTMNDIDVKGDSALPAIVQEGKNVFSVQYQENGGIPYNLQVSYNTFTPPNSEKAELKLFTQLAAAQTKVGETVRMDISVTNKKSGLQPMAVAKIGIPAGLSVQPWQLKDIMEKNQVAYYEIFDNYLVLYWMGFAPNETKTIKLDLKAEIPGTYKGKASNTWLYYTPEHKHWNDGIEVEVLAK